MPLDPPVIRQTGESFIDQPDKISPLVVYLDVGVQERMKVISIGPWLAAGNIVKTTVVQPFFQIVDQFKQVVERI